MRQVRASSHAVLQSCLVEMNLRSTSTATFRSWEQGECWTFASWSIQVKVRAQSMFKDVLYRSRELSQHEIFLVMTSTRSSKAESAGLWGFLGKFLAEVCDQTSASLSPRDFIAQWRRHTPGCLHQRFTAIFIPIGHGQADSE